jgi:DNA-binding response OmpR family regulator
MKVLLAEDDAQIAGPVLRAFERAGLSTEWVTHGDAADAALAAGPWDAAVLDIGLPGRDGIDVLRRLRDRGDPLPVLLLTARDEVGDRVLGLDAGADDYLVKPFDMVELEARVRALLRRGRGTAGVAPIRLGRLSLRGDETVPRLDDAPLELSPREAGVLAILLRRAGRAAGTVGGRSVGDGPVGRGGRGDGAPAAPQARGQRHRDPHGARLRLPAAGPRCLRPPRRGSACARACCDGCCRR